MFPTTPTMVIQPSGFDGLPNVIRLPIGSRPSSKKRRTDSSLITATRVVPARSSAVMRRPRTSGMFIVAK